MNITISLVEDNNSFRASLAQLINSTKGLAIKSEYANAENALKMIKDPPHIAIIDLELPDMNGINLIKKLSEKNHDIEYLVCSSHDDDRRIFSALEAGASGYILKDSTSEEIIAAIMEIFNNGSPLSPFVARRIINSIQKKRSPAGESLTEREKEVLELMSKGLLYKQIASELSITRETVKKHLQNIYQKLGVQNKIEALHKMNML